MNDSLRAARDAYARRDWRRARDCFRAAREDTDLPADDLSALAGAAWWLGDVEESLNVGEEVYRRYLHGDQTREAAMAALEIAVSLFLRGDEVLGSGWMSRAQRLLQDHPDGVEQGYVFYLLEVEGALGGIAKLDGVDFEAVISKARIVQESGRRHGDPNLIAAGILGEGRALVKRGRVIDGLALLDEATLAVLSDELSPDWAGNIYCHLMAAYHELADVRRAGELVEATARWLETLSPAVLFTGICQVHRSQVLQVKGAWEQAEREAARVCESLESISVATAAEGHYQVGELRRLRGDLIGAEAAYQEAHRRGRDPQPGLALLRLAQGRVEAASASIRAALLAQTGDRLARFRLCAARVEIALAAGEIEVARQACDELQVIEQTYHSSGFEAAAAHACGWVLLAEGRSEEALPVLREACRLWRELDAPYEAARVCLLLAETYRALDVVDAASFELNAAATVFERLGAVADAAKVAEFRGLPQLPNGLTEREVEVLALVAAGRSNREVATSLVISEKTVARHLSNIFTKVGVSSRTEAAAYAFEHGLTPSGRA